MPELLTATAAISTRLPVNVHAHAPLAGSWGSATIAVLPSAGRAPAAEWPVASL